MGRSRIHSSGEKNINMLPTVKSNSHNHWYIWKICKEAKYNKDLPWLVATLKKTLISPIKGTYKLRINQSFTIYIWLTLNQSIPKNSQNAVWITTFLRVLGKKNWFADNCCVTKEAEKSNELVYKTIRSIICHLTIDIELFKIFQNEK